MDIGALGAACFSIPITVPTGINGIQPCLGVSYNSQTGNGLLGWGWNLTGISMINRVNNTLYHNGNIKAVNFYGDQYAIDGQRLIMVENSSKDPNTKEYKTESDGFSRIVAYTRMVGGGGMFGLGQHETVTHFIVWTPDGKKIEYGLSDDSRIYLQEQNDVCLWLVNRVEDRNGNYMEFHYDKNTYGYQLTSITYTGNDAVFPTLSPFCEVVFNYDTRSDVETTTIGPDVMKYADLLKSIVIYKRNVIEQSFTELYRYDFEYLDVNRPLGYLYSRLNKIKFSCDEQHFNPTLIIWPNLDNHVEYYHKPINIPNHENAFQGAVKFPGDFNGDGFTDVIVTKPSNGVYSEAELYLNKGGSDTISFEYIRSFDLSEHIDWIHAGDFNGDGKEDLLFVEKELRDWPFRDRIYITAHLSDNASDGSIIFRELPTLGPYKVKRSFRDTKVSVLIGDYFGKGYDSFIIQSSLLDEDNPETSFEFDQAYYIECAADGQSLVEVRFDESMNSYRFFPADYDGDGATEILFLTDSDCRINKVKQYGNGYHYETILSQPLMNKEYDCYPGDFNGDGKTDMLSCHINENNESIWQLNMCDGFSFGDPIIIDDLGGYDYLWPSYVFSLQNPRFAVYYVKVADFNGDGYCDVKLPKQGDSYNEYFYFGPIVGNSPYAPFARKKLLYPYHATNDNMSACLGYFTGKETCDDLGGDAVLYLMPSSERYSINKIVDGMNNNTEFEYDYLMPNPDMPGEEDFYSLDTEASDLSKHVLTRGMPIKALKRMSVENASKRPVRVNYQYKGLMYHQWGNGILGFTSIIERNSIEIKDREQTHEENISSSEHLFNLTDYDPFIALAPTASKMYDKNGFLITETYYENEVYTNTNSTNQKVFVPVVSKTLTNDYDVDNECFLRKSIVETAYYNDGTDHQYENIIRSVSTNQGVTSNPNTTLASSCQFRAFEEIDYQPDDLDAWLINRPSKVKSVNYDNNAPSVGTCVEYEYYETDGFRHLTKSATNYPNNNVATGPDESDPLTTKIEYSYDGFGRIETETLTAPNDNTLPTKTNMNIYGPEYDYRLLTRSINTLGDETNFTYDDDYDYCSSVTDLNGMTTYYQQDPLGMTKRTINPDGTESCQALRWEHFSFNAVQYYIWSKTTGGAPTKEYKDKLGMTYKTVTKSFGGEDIVTDIAYDQYGRVQSHSLPHLENDTPELISYEYDDHNRPTITNNPDGTKQEIVYNGLETTVKTIAVDNSEQSTSTLVNLVGWTSKVTDANNQTVDYGYYPNGSLHWVKVNGSEHVKNEIQYDHLGNRIWHKDPDYGISTNLYNAYGEMKRQENPRGYVTSFDYDILGRLVTKETRDANNHIEESIVWGYSSEEGRKGLLSSINYNNNEQIINYSYDGLLRLNSISEHINGDDRIFLTSYTYDPASRIQTTTYPTGVSASRHYNPYGYLSKISESANGMVWQTDEINEKGMITQFTLGNGTHTQFEYDEQNSHLKRIQTKRNAFFIQNMSYDYDYFHNLAARTDNKRNLTESFLYDNLNRLTNITLNNVPKGVMTYDVYGRMTSKTADGQLVFSTSQNSFDLANKPHALQSAEWGSNMPHLDDQTIVYTPFDKVKTFTEGDNSLSYDYGYNHQRIKMSETVNGATRQKLYVGNCEFVETADSKTAYTFLNGPTGVFAVVESNNGNNSIHYIHKDHLGSWTTITNDYGSVEQELSFDAWGNLRNPETWTGNFEGTPLFDRGYTGHEHLTAFGLINMNGRCYDPVMSSFLSVDAFVDNPTTAQGFNRYAYCMHNPLRYTDPSGWKKQGREPGNPFHENWSRSYVEPVHEPRDYQNPYYLLNMAFYGSFEGYLYQGDLAVCNGGFSAGESGALENSYGYYATHYANSVYNYCFPSAQLQLIRNWQSNPCKLTSKEVEEAGIYYVSVGISIYNGYQNSTYDWKDKYGSAHSATVSNEYVGNRPSEAYCFSFKPTISFGEHNPNNSIGKANIIAQSLGVPMGTISEGFDMGAKSYYGVSSLKASSGLSKTQYVNALTKEGYVLMRASKLAGKACFALSAGTEVLQLIDYGINGGKDFNVYAKGLVDIAMGAVGFLGPIGLGISIAYFVVDLSTDGLNGWGKITY